jgi:betaine-aldehyde dehydrogenase
MAYETQQLYYDGKVQSASNKGKTFLTINPSTGRPLANVATASSTDIDQAIESAKKAFPYW